MSDDSSLPFASQIDRLNTLMATVVATSEYTRSAVAEDKMLLIGVLKLLRGDEQGGGGLTGRILLLERQTEQLSQRLEKFEQLREEHERQGARRRWEVVGWVIGSGLGTAAFIRILSKLLNE